MSYRVAKADLKSDKQQIIDFWNSQNPKPLEQKFSWIYEGNPDGDADTWVIEHEDSNEIIGMISVFPRFFTHAKKLYKAGIQGDFFIHPKHRSFGPALMLVRAIAKNLDQSDYDFLYGFPNATAEPVFKRAGFSILGQPTKFTRLYDIERLIQTKFSVNSSIIRIPALIGNKLLNFLYRDSWLYNLGRYTSCITRTPDPQVEELADDYQRIESTTNKTKTYLTWKYTDDPDDDNYFYNVFNRQNLLIGCILYRHDLNTIEIRDALYRDRNSAIDLFALFFRMTKKSGVEYAYLDVYSANGFRQIIDELQLTKAQSGQSIYYKLPSDHVKSQDVLKLLNSKDFLLLRTDQDT
jgi:GNAT superfamily N-acetyltransferase